MFQKYFQWSLLFIGLVFGSSGAWARAIAPDVVHCVSSDDFIVSGPDEVNYYDFEFTIDLATKKLQLFVNKGAQRIPYFETTQIQEDAAIVNSMTSFKLAGEREGHKVVGEAMYAWGLSRDKKDPWASHQGELRLRGFWDGPAKKAVEVHRMMNCEIL